ncbi:acyltransferase [Glutamicibacter sp. 363]|uniref:acyltransferase n=1 Tax=Glutamicibacter sp. 363 TaxID=3457731 RepID=UPI0040344A8A
MIELTALSSYEDELGNRIESPTVFEKNITIKIRGKNNRVLVDPEAKIGRLDLVFDCDNGTLLIGPSKKKGWQLNIRIGQDATVQIGRDLTTTAKALVSAVEGVTVRFGDDVMIASGNQFRADDGHPIFDVKTGKRINPAKDITVGSHVWIGAQAALLAGASIGDGSVIGYRSLVTGKIPNNVIAAGTPARVLRRNIAWERPHLSFHTPPYKPDASTVTKSQAYWNNTVEAQEHAAIAMPQVQRQLPKNLIRRAAAKIGRITGA